MKAKLQVKMTAAVISDVTQWREESISQPSLSI